MKKVETHSEPLGDRMGCTQPKPKPGPCREKIAHSLQDDKSVPKKQCRAATRIYHRLKKMGYLGILSNLCKKKVDTGAGVIV